jgi:hypothetical protein
MALQQLPTSTSSQLREVDRTVSIAEVARLANKHEATVRRWCKKGALPGAHQEGPREADPWAIPVSALVAVNWCSDADLDQLDERLNSDSVQVPRRLHTLEEDGVWQRANPVRRDTRLS